MSAPQFALDRLAKFERLAEKHTVAAPEETVTLTLPDGKTFDCPASTTALEAAKLIVRSSKVYSKFLVASRDGELIDLSRPVERSCKMEFLTFEDPRGREVFWHSSAHALGYALECLFSAQLGHGPATESGFFYDAFVGDKVMSPEDLAAIDAKVKELCAKPQKRPAEASAESPAGSSAGASSPLSPTAFQRLEISKEEALDLFSYSPLKSELIRDHVADGDTCTVYRCGNFVDFCRGPHIPDLSLIQAFQCSSCSAAYFKGDQTRESMQRVYAVAFPTAALLKQHLDLLEEAKRRDHRTVGKEMDLFLIHKFSPGAPLFMNNGTHIYRKLESFIRELLHKHYYQEVMTPTFFNTDLWKISGHLAHYSENMFMLRKAEIPNPAYVSDEATPGVPKTVEDPAAPQYGLKPMNCPAHCLIYKSQYHTAQDLPIRMSEFGVVHRNELSGALSGLTRVVKFEQDDAHIFCTVDQIETEMRDILSFLESVYEPFGLSFAMRLSLRPDDRIGSDELWDHAEGTLRKVLQESGYAFTEMPGDGAFYGPKIDVLLLDAIGRKHQCGTVQLDFNLPSQERFDLQYSRFDEAQGKQVMEHPVMIHRAILGSVERFMAILIEHTCGRFPFWLSPRQVLVVPLSADQQEYARAVQRKIHDAGYLVDIDCSGEKMEKKVALGWTKKYNFILVLGSKEAQAGTVAVSGRTLSAVEGVTENPKFRKSMSLDDFLALMQRLDKGRENK